VIKLAMEINGKGHGSQADREIQAETATQTQDRITPVLVGIFLALIAIGFLGILVANSSLFQIKSVLVKGNRVIAAETIVLATRITRNQSILSLNRQRMRQAILQNPYIAKAELDLVWPHRVIIRITERRPVCWTVWGGSSYLVGDDGTVLEAATAARRAEFPEVFGVQFKNLQVGAPISVPDMATALTILNSCDRKLRSFLVRLDMTRNQLHFNYPDRFHSLVVDLGNADHLAKKTANLRAILAKDHDQIPIRIDLRVPEISTVTARTSD
jgi:hypothetical protein